jgi:hypothetical protein
LISKEDPMKTLLASLLLALLPLGDAHAGERFACNMKALDATERARHQELTKALLSAAQEKRELPHGYGFRLPPSSLMSAAEWVSFERKCCPFFTFELEQARDEGPVWLRVTGSDGVKAFIRAEFQLGAD